MLAPVGAITNLKNSRTGELADNLERLNLYRDVSWCTDKKQLKPFCYCGKREESA